MKTESIAINPKSEGDNILAKTTPKKNSKMSVEN